MSAEPPDDSDEVEPDGSRQATDEAATPTSAVVMSAGDTTVIARTVARVAVPIIAIVSIALLIQGHNLPGGGFIGAVLTSTAFVLLFVVYGLDFVREEAFPATSGRSGNANGVVDAYRTLFGIGLALAVGSGLVPMLLPQQYPFLTQGVVFLKGVPLYQELEIASALAFDLGVYLVVVGGLLTIVGRVGQE
jgi:multicomponent Na+:H+ antiporter subunit B